MYMRSMYFNIGVNIGVAELLPAVGQLLTQK